MVLLSSTTITFRPSSLKSIVLPPGYYLAKLLEVSVTDGDTQPSTAGYFLAY
jgi:hypothetical protein